MERFWKRGEPLVALSQICIYARSHVLDEEICTYDWLIKSRLPRLLLGVEHISQS
jgi:hypothetical protein